ncbi:MAG: hypothetical protein BWX77_00355 [Bacteroidetes bacterium ADurb.Bin090]|nr:MAG: hypothetical protein BWX77_00355 [Bacteroidetes bacterium ADurb.Bin090]
MADVVGNPGVKFVDLFVAQKPGFTQPAGIDQGTATKLEGFESLIGIHHVGTTQHYSMILEYNGLVFYGFEHFGDVTTQLLAARTSIRSVAYFSTNVFGLGDDIGIGYLPGNAKSHQSGRMSVDHRGNFGTGIVDGLVKRIFRRGFVFADDFAVRFNADYIPESQSTFIYTRGGDPNIAVFVLDGNIASGGGGHATAINAANDHIDLFGRMHEFGI